MSPRTKIVLVTGALALTAVIPTIAIAGNDADIGDREAPIGGPDLEHATRVALEHLGGGTVTGTEVGDEDSLYEVEVTLEDGTEVDVQLDEDFQVIGSETDNALDDRDR